MFSQTHNAIPLSSKGTLKKQTAEVTHTAGSRRLQTGGWWTHLLRHLHIYLWKSRALQSVHLNPQATLTLPERREETSLNVEAVKPACEDMAAVTEIPRHSEMSILKRQALGSHDGSGWYCRGLEFSSHYLHGGSRLSTTPILGDQMTSSDLQTYGVHVHICWQKHLHRENKVSL